jgi:hypothetical protein
VFQDFVISAVITLLWLISSAAWAQGLVDLKYFTDFQESGMFDKIPECKTVGCVQTDFPKFGSLNASVVSFPELSRLKFMKCLIGVCSANSVFRHPLSDASFYIMMLSIYMYWFSVNGHVFQDPVVHKSVKFY